MPTSFGVSELRERMASAGPPPPEDADDYRIAMEVGPAFLARGRSSLVTLIVPLTAIGGAIARSGGGFTLASAPRMAFDNGGRRWEQPAAILECTDEKLGDTFLVLVSDLVRRLSADETEITWRKILLWVEEWQMLLAPRTALSIEDQLGLWGELWVMSRANDVDRIFAAWRGPDAEAVDFFHDGAGLEVKVSRRARVHHISQSQVDAPRGQHVSYLLSIWVGVESIRGISLTELIEQLLAKLSDPAAFLRQLARVGYSPQDKDEYTTRYVPLDAPLWFRAEDLPRVRAFDDGISNLRYLVTLNIDTCLDRTHSADLWRHFCGAESSDTSEWARTR